MTGATGSVDAVIVTWNPGPVLEQVVDAILPQVRRVRLVDNGSERPTQDMLDALAARAGGAVTVTRNPGNHGLAAAQNQGIAAALGDGAGWVLLLDHDSVAAPDMVARQLAAYRADPAPEGIGLLAPVLYDDAGTLRPTHWVARPPFWLPRSRPVPPGAVVDEVLFAIASGSLMPARTFRAVGTMREAFFVDYVDFDFSFRLRRAGLRLVAVGDARLEHRIGELTRGRVLGRAVRANTHSARRRYTIYRNRTRLWREYGLRMPGFVLFELGSVAIDLAKLAAIEDDRIAKLAAILRGTRDGLCGRGDTFRS